MIYLSIGSNLGSRLYNIQQALAKLAEINFVVCKQTPIIETTALLTPNAPPEWDLPYLNMVVAGTSHATPQQLLQQLQNIESEFGRIIPHPRWSPRIIDLDILLIDQMYLQDELLTIPHREILNRPFLIHLLAMIAPDKKHPLTQQSWTEIAYQSSVENCFIKSIVAYPALVGVVNITPDSFSDGGLFYNTEAAVKKILELQNDGASIIELGAQTTKPAAQMVTANKEYARLATTLQQLQIVSKLQNFRLGIDSFSPEVLIKILDQYSIAWVNDVKGITDKTCLQKIAASGCLFVAMHSLSVPPNQKDVINFDLTPANIISAWAKQKIAYLLDCGFKKSQIIIDPGIGFSKTPYQSLALLNTIEKLADLEVALCVGHSRKSFMNMFNQRDASERDIETIAVSQQLVVKNITYLRVHNVTDHQRFFVAQESLQSLRGGSLIAI